MNVVVEGKWAVVKACELCRRCDTSDCEVTTGLDPEAGRDIENGEEFNASCDSTICADASKFSDEMIGRECEDRPEYENS